MQAGPWELQDLGRRPGETQQLAQSASGLKGYIIVVKGYTDSTGSAAMNTTLSQDRAQAVINYLVQQGGIKIRHITAPGAYGETDQAASNETASGRAENRRVEVPVRFAAAVFSSLSISAATAKRGMRIFGSRPPL